MSSLLLIASVSKVPFYIAGGALALWAVVLAGLGLSRPEFPGGAGGARAVMGISLVLALLAIGFAIHTATFGG